MHEIWYGTHPLRYLLMPLSGLTWIAIKVRRIWHTRTRPAPPTAPVLIVGNLTVGGTGKTPLTLAIAEHLSRIGCRPGIASGGYGGRCTHYPHQVTVQDSAEQVGDEALMLRRKSAYPIVVAPDRCAAVARLIDAADAAGTPIVPSTMGEEKATNPFLRAVSAEVKANVGLPGADDASAFAEVRRRKDNF